ncbi:MAG: aminotransferase class V-fold PLP-dependent enzyme [Oscillospiraceae bacterium]|nr:aminotransferase class V-fold PLP-dependent enzyme [Oscillospiraceae bacterium]
MIYLDNAATTLQKPPRVTGAVAEAMGSLGNGGRGVHGGALAADRTIFSAREKLAAFFGCGSPERVCFSLNATEALNTALFGLLSPGDHVVATDWEHNSALRPLYHLREAGVEVTFLGTDARGRLDYGEMEAAVQGNTRAMVCTHASNLTGNLADLDRVGEIARRHGLLLIVDAAQTAGAFPIQMEAHGIAALCFTGHKGMFGPQGTGGLLVGQGVEIRPLKMGGTGVQTYLERQPEAYPTRLEAGTLNGHGIAGLSAAVDFINETGVATIHRRELELALRFYAGVRNLPGVTVYGDFSGDRAPIVSLNLGEQDSGAVADALHEEYGIAVRSGGHCAPRMHRALGTERQGAVRFSFGYYNTEADADAAIEAVRALTE